MMTLKKEICENIDRLITVDIGGRGVIRKLYPPARERQGDDPLTFLAANRLINTVKKDDVVFIISGMLIYPFNVLGETDGPLGAAALARSLQVGLGAKPIIITDNVLVDMMTATVRGIGLNVLSIDRFREVPLSTVVLGFPVDEGEAINKAKELIDEFKPKALIAVERRGRTEEGIYPSWKGKNMAPYEAKVVYLFEEAIRRDILTIGIGDGGNEIGCGKIKDVVKKEVPYGDIIADNTNTDITVMATVSNWGAYGIAAALSAFLEMDNVLHTYNDELRMLRECIDAGGIDGIIGLPVMSVDDIPGEIHGYLIEMLHEIVRGGLKGPK